MLILYDLETEYRRNPIGLDEPHPAFSWKLRSARYSGQRASMRKLPSCGIVCQIRSVINGMNGCSRRRIWSST